MGSTGQHPDSANDQLMKCSTLGCLNTRAHTTRECYGECGVLICKDCSGQSGLDEGHCLGFYLYCVCECTRKP